MFFIMLTGAFLSVILQHDLYGANVIIFEGIMAFAYKELRNVSLQVVVVFFFFNLIWIAQPVKIHLKHFIICFGK